MKICSKCKTPKKLDAFTSDSTRKDGHYPQCKECRQAFREANRAKVNESKRAHYAANRDAIAIKQRAYYDANLQRKLDYAKAYKRAHPELVSDYTHRRRAAKRANGVFVVPKGFMKRLYASPCFYCGTSGRIEADHVIPISRGGRHSMGNLVPACKTCNSSKSDKLITEWRKAG